MKIITSGESHGPAMTVIIDGYPSGVTIDVAVINAALKARMQGVGRGPRMALEADQVEILSGIRHGKTIGSPITLQIHNHDYANWQEAMDSQMKPDADTMVRTTVRPGHADYAGALKYGHRQDVRNVLERASARSSVSYVAAGSLAQILLTELGITVSAEVIEIGGRAVAAMTVEEYAAVIEKIRGAKDTVGGKVLVCATGVPAGLGSYSQWEQKLDARIAAAMMSIPTTKAVEIGAGVQAAQRLGSQLHDELFFDQHGKVYRQTNNAGGIEGGISNGETIAVTLSSKPIPTLMQPLRSVDLKQRAEAIAFVERSDVSVLEAYAVISKAMLALLLTQVICEQYDSDTLAGLQNSFAYLRRLDEV